MRKLESQQKVELEDMKEEKNQLQVDNNLPDVRTLSGRCSLEDEPRKRLYRRIYLSQFNLI